MPLREISNNKRTYSRVLKEGGLINKKFTTQESVKVGKISTSSIKKPATYQNKDFVCKIHNNVAAKDENAYSTKDKPFENQHFDGTKKSELVFLDAAKDWDCFLSDATTNWSTKPEFKQCGDTICCLLCGKSIRTPQVDKIVVEKHVNGTHHKKCFQLLNNLKQLKKADVTRYKQLMALVTDADTLPAANYTQKQLLAYYHNVHYKAKNL